MLMSVEWTEKCVKECCKTIKNDQEEKQLRIYISIFGCENCHAIEDEKL